MDGGTIVWIGSGVIVMVYAISLYFLFSYLKKEFDNLHKDIDKEK